MRALATSGHQLHAAVQHVLKMPGTKKRVKEINAFFRKIRKQKEDRLDRITVLQLKKMRLNSKDCNILAHIFVGGHFAFLKVLGMCGNSIGSVGTREISGALRDNRVLSSMDLSYNKLGAEGGMAIAGALHVNRALTSLDLHVNSIRGDGAKAIGDALCVNRVLTEVRALLNLRPTLT